MSQGYYGDEAAGYGGEPAVPKGNPPAVISMVCGLLGCLCVTAPLAVIFGVVGLRQARDPYVTGRGMAITGLVLGTIWLVALGSCGTIIGIGWSMYGKPIMTASKFAVLMSQGDVDAAMAETTEIDRQRLVADSQALRASGPIRGLSPDPSTLSKTTVAGQPEEVTMSGSLIYPGGPMNNKTFSMTLIKLGNEYKVRNYSFR